MCQPDLDFMKPVLLRVESRGSSSQTPRRSSAHFSVLLIQCVGPSSFGGHHGLQGHDLGAVSGLHKVHFHIVRSPLLLTYLYS